MKKLIVLLMTILTTALFAVPSFAGETMMGKGTSGKMGNTTFTPEQLVGLNVNNMEGEHVGQIRDVKQSPETGEIYYVIVGSSLLGIGETKHAVPLDVLKIQGDKSIATLLVAEDTLESAPSNATGKSEEEFMVILQKHYGIDPELGKGMGAPRGMMK